MRVLLLSIMMVFLGVNSWALNKNPLIRTCHIDGGQFWVLQVPNDDLALCFFGSYAIGAESFFLFKTKAGLPQSIQAYKNRHSSSPRGGVCGAYGADVIQGKDTEGQVFNVCRFRDNSMIEETTLWLGPGSVESHELDKALSSTY